MPRSGGRGPSQPEAKIPASRNPVKAAGPGVARLRTAATNRATASARTSRPHGWKTSKTVLPQPSKEQEFKEMSIINNVTNDLPASVDPKATQPPSYRDGITVAQSNGVDPLANKNV